MEKEELIECYVCKKAFKMKSIKIHLARSENCREEYPLSKLNRLKKLINKNLKENKSTRNKIYHKQNKSTILQHKKKYHAQNRSMILQQKKKYHAKTGKTCKKDGKLL